LLQDYLYAWNQKLFASPCVFHMGDFDFACDFNVGNEAVWAGDEDALVGVCVCHDGK